MTKQSPYSRRIRAGRTRHRARETGTDRVRPDDSGRLPVMARQQPSRRTRTDRPHQEKLARLGMGVCPSALPRGSVDPERAWRCGPFSVVQSGRIADCHCQFRQDGESVGRGDRHAEFLTLRGHGGGVESASFSADGSRIVTGSWDKTAKVWDAKTGEVLLTLNGARISDPLGVVQRGWIADRHRKF